MSGETSSGRVLVVDDDSDICELARVVLGDAGHEVLAVSSGREALDRVAAERFDLVLLDINMPGMDGWETLRLIRADTTLEDLDVVMFSVKGEVQDKIQGLQEGAADYIAKPFVVDELRARVQRVIDERRAAGDQQSGPDPRP